MGSFTAVFEERSIGLLASVFFVVELWMQDERSKEKLVFVSEVIGLGHLETNGPTIRTVLVPLPLLFEKELSTCLLC
jgi:hypothetical protein